jgi:hypothetical protein
LASHHAISASRQKPLSARSRMRTRGQRTRIWPMMRAISATVPAATTQARVKGSGL